MEQPRNINYLNSPIDFQKLCTVGSRRIPKGRVETLICKQRFISEREESDSIRESRVSAEDSFSAGGQDLEIGDCRDAGDPWGVVIR